MMHTPASEILTMTVSNHIPVPSDVDFDSFEHQLAHRLHIVQPAPGFIRFEVHRPIPKFWNSKTEKWESDNERLKSECYQVKTWWKSFESHIEWTKGKAFRVEHKATAPEAHAGISQVHIDEVFLSSDVDIKSGMKTSKLKASDDHVIVVTQNFPFAFDKRQAIEQELLKRIHEIDKSNGFIRNEVYIPRNLVLEPSTGKFYLDSERQTFCQIRTWWRNFEHFVQWSHDFHEEGPIGAIPADGHLSVHRVIESTDLEIHHHNKHAQKNPNLNLRIFTMDELNKFKGFSKIYIAINGDIFDVSHAVHLYGPKGKFNLLAGTDATCVFAHMTSIEEEATSIEEKLKEDPASLTEEQKDHVKEWHDLFLKKYPVVGKLVSKHPRL